MNKVQAAKTIIKLAKALATDQKNSRTAGAKYTLDKRNTINDYGTTLYRVKYADGTLGGWIRSKKNLQGNAKVLDDAKVRDDAVVKDNAVVKGRSVIYGNAVVSGNAIVCKTGYVYGNAKVSDNAIVENSYVNNNASVSKHAQVLNGSYVDATVTDQAIVNKSRVSSNATVFGKADINKSWIADRSQVSGIVQDSEIKGKSIIKGKVKNCFLRDRVVEKDESLENQDD